MPKHLPIQGPCPKLFEWWLQLFKEITQELGNPSVHRHANMLVYRITNRLWTRYQIQHYPDKPLLALRGP